jgi:hypothetical protein
MAHFDRWIGQRRNVLDSLAENVLRRVRPQRGDALWEFVREISKDQGAMVQLTPESMDLFNASVPDRENVKYACFVSASPPPRLRSFPIDPRDVYRSATHIVYAISYKIASREHRHYPYPLPDTPTLDEIRSCLPFPVDSRSNDGIVPTLSQIRGQLGGVVNGDHLDVVGQFQQTSEDSVYTTWLFSGSGFDENRFRGLWSRIAKVVAEAQL